MTQYQYIDFLPNQSPVVEESDNLLTETVTETAPPPPPVFTAPVESPLPQRSSLIRINPKYSRVLTDNTENIAAPEDDAKAKSRSTESPTSSGRSIKINPKYANIAGGPLIPQPRPMISVNPQYQGLGNINTKITDDGKASVLKGGDLELQRVKTRVEVMNTKSNRLSDIIAESNSTFKLSQTSRETEPLRTSDVQNISKNRFKRAAEMLMPSKQAKRSRLSENLENLRRHTADSSSLGSSLGSVPASSIPRRYSDRIDRITGPVPALPTFMTKERPQEAVEPLPGLWKFLRALLHSPAYNPKIVNWEILEEGMFRIHNLSNFYTIWKELKKTDINYDLLTKSIKIYDEKKVLHAVYNHRCVYKFGQNASDWKPSDLEIILICRKPVPNPATWHTSRFYGDLEHSSSSLPSTTTTTETSSSSPVSAPTTLFTLTPLDSSSTQLSEMKVMSDHSRIITTNNFSATLPSGSVSLSPPPPSLSVKSCTDAMAEIKIESIADEVTDEKIETKNIEHMEDLLQPKVEDIEVDCSLILPHQSDLKAVLRLPGG